MAAAIAEGGEPYRDIRYFYGPAGVYSLAGAFAVFGTSFTTAFAFGLVQAAAIVGAFYALARQLLRVVPAFLATAIVAAIGFSGTAFNFVLPHTNSATFGVLFVLLMLLALCARAAASWPASPPASLCLTRPEFAAVAALIGRRLPGRQLAPAGPAPGAARRCRGWPCRRCRRRRRCWRCSPPSAGAANLFTENLWPVDFLRVAGFSSQQAWTPLRPRKRRLDPRPRRRLLRAAGRADRRRRLGLARARDRASGCGRCGRSPRRSRLLVVGVGAWRLLGRLAPTPAPRSSTSAPTC